MAPLKCFRMQGFHIQHIHPQFLKSHLAFSWYVAVQSVWAAGPVHLASEEFHVGPRSFLWVQPVFSLGTCRFLDAVWQDCSHKTAKLWAMTSWWTYWSQNGHGCCFFYWHLTCCQLSTVEPFEVHIFVLPFGARIPKRPRRPSKLGLGTWIVATARLESWRIMDLIRWLQASCAKCRHLNSWDTVGPSSDRTCWWCEGREGESGWAGNQSWKPEAEDGDGWSLAQGSPESQWWPGLHEDDEDVALDDGFAHWWEWSSPALTGGSHAMPGLEVYASVGGRRRKKWNLQTKTTSNHGAKAEEKKSRVTNIIWRNFTWLAKSWIMLNPIQIRFARQKAFHAELVAKGFPSSPSSPAK